MAFSYQSVHHAHLCRFTTLVVSPVVYRDPLLFAGLLLWLGFLQGAKTASAPHPALSEPEGKGKGHTPW